MIRKLINTCTANTVKVIVCKLKTLSIAKCLVSCPKSANWPDIPAVKFTGCQWMGGVIWVMIFYNEIISMDLNDLKHFQKYE